MGSDLGIFQSTNPTFTCENSRKSRWASTQTEIRNEYLRSTCNAVAELTCLAYALPYKSTSDFQPWRAAGPLHRGAATSLASTGGSARFPEQLIRLYIIPFHSNQGWDALSAKLPRTLFLTLDSPASLPDGSVCWIKMIRSCAKAAD
jgi:hypothetical protein